MRAAYLCAVAFAWKGEVVAWALRLTSEQAEALRSLLEGLGHLGHIAAYTIAPFPGITNEAQLEDALRDRLGDIVVEAVKRSSRTGALPTLSLLVPVSAFDTDAEGLLVATARFLSAEAEVTAVSSFDEEIGFPVSGCTGLFLPLVMPFSAWR